MAEGGLLNFVLSLEDRFSPATRSSAKSLKELSNELSTSKGKLALYQQQLGHSKQLGDIEGYRKYSKLVEEARKETFELGNAMAAAGGPAQKMGEKIHAVVEPAEVARHALEEVGGGFRELGGALAHGDVKGAIEGTTEALAGMASMLDLVVPGLGQAASAVIKAAGAIGGAFAEIVEEGVKTALEVGEVNERLTATFNALGVQGPASGKKTLAMLDEMSNKLPQTREQLAEWTKTYEAMGVTDLSEIRNELRATASAQAIMGQQGAEAYETIRRKVQEAIEAHHGLKMSEKSLTALYKAGVNVTDIADRMGLSTNQLTAKLKAGTIDAEKFGEALRTTLTEKGKGPLEAMSNEVGTLKQKGMETFQHLFDGIDTKPITDAIKGLIGIADQANPSGRSLKEGIGGALQGIINWLGKMGHEAKIVFLEMELYAVKHKGQLKLLAEGFAMMGNTILHATGALESLLSAASKPPPAWLMALLGVTANAALGGGALGSVAGAAVGHAEGGLVKRPAAGEFFASVAPGEMILPQRGVRELAGGGLGPMGRAAVAANTNGSGRSVHIGQIVIQAPNGVTDAQQLSVTGLALALERYQLGSGR